MPIRGSAPSKAPPKVIDNGSARELGHSRVIEIQRARLLTALFEVSAERGAGNVAVAHIVERAGVSRRTFYELFADREQCFLAGLEEALARATRYVLDEYEPHAPWVERVRSALVGLLSFMDAEPGAARLLVVGSLAGGASALNRRQNVFLSIISLVEEGRSESKGGSELPSLTAEGVVGGAVSVLHTRLSRDDPGSLLELTGPLMGMIVLPYLGPAAARKQLARPAPARRPAGRPAAGDPLRDVGMRLTYRTVRVLGAVAANPGASNREVGLAAGMEDQGQISKLLARLQRLELIHNTRPPVARGAPNAWGLTQRGWEVQRAIVGEGSPG